MDGLLQVDIDTLQTLGKKLADRAKNIGAIDHTVPVTMSDGPLDAVSRQASETVLAAYRFLGGHIDKMSATTQSGAKTYAQVETDIAFQFLRYTSGVPL